LPTERLGSRVTTAPIRWRHAAIAPRGPGRLPCGINVTVKAYTFRPAPRPSASAPQSGRRKTCRQSIRFRSDARERVMTSIKKPKTMHTNPSSSSCFSILAFPRIRAASRPQLATAGRHVPLTTTFRRPHRMTTTPRRPAPPCFFLPVVAPATRRKPIADINSS